MTITRVVVADDDPLARHALVHMIDAVVGMEVVGEACDGERAVALCMSSSPDVVLMDLRMPGCGGVEATRRILDAQPHVAVIIVTILGTIGPISDALIAGASGYLLKDSEPSTIISAIHAARTGAIPLTPQVIRQLFDKAPALGGERPSRPLTTTEALTARESQVVALLARGRSNAEMAEALFLSEASIKSHISAVMAKWQVRDRVQVLIRAIMAGVVTAELDPANSLTQNQAAPRRAPRGT